MRKGLLAGLGSLALALSSQGCDSRHFYRVNRPTYSTSYWSPFKSAFKNKEGELAPDFEFRDDKTGKNAKLSDYRGKGVIIFFFNCDDDTEACNGPLFHLSNQNGEKVDVIGVHKPRMHCSRESDLDFFTNRFDTKFPIHTDNGDITPRFYNGAVVPATVIVDREGKIAYQGMGFPKDFKKFLGK